MTPQRDTANGSGPWFHRISVIVPANPVIRDALHDVRQHAESWIMPSLAE
jgi:hypothetical protein